MAEKFGNFFPFRIHTSPMEDFGKVYHRESKFSKCNYLPYDFRLDLSQGDY